jgi:GNAT superfamily N-acetyltransferase
VIQDKSIAWLAPSDTASLIEILTEPKGIENLWHAKSKREMAFVVAKWLKNENLYCFVKHNRDGSLAGFLKLRRWEHERRKHVAWIGPLAVAESARRQGCATALLTETMEFCKSIGVSRIEIMAPEDATEINGWCLKMALCLKVYSVPRFAEVFEVPLD